MFITFVSEVLFSVASVYFRKVRADGKRLRLTYSYRHEIFSIITFQYSQYMHSTLLTAV